MTARSEGDDDEGDASVAYANASGRFGVFDIDEDGRAVLSDVAGDDETSASGRAVTTRRAFQVPDRQPDRPRHL